MTSRRIGTGIVIALAVMLGVSFSGGQISPAALLKTGLPLYKTS